MAWKGREMIEAERELRRAVRELVGRLICSLPGVDHRWSPATMQCDRCGVTREELLRAGPAGRKRLPR